MKKNQFNPYDNRKNTVTAPKPAAGAFVQPRPPYPREQTAISRAGKALPENYVDMAESVINDLKQKADEDRRQKPITSTKLRNLFNLFSDVYNQCQRQEGDLLNENQLAALRVARIRMVYECGREEAVKSFVDRTDMLDYLQGIGNSREKLIRYYHYLEALVAYGRYSGLTKDEK